MQKKLTRFVVWLTARFIFQYSFWFSGYNNYYLLEKFIYLKVKGIEIC